MPNISKKYDAELQKYLAGLQKRILVIYNNAIVEISLSASTIKLNGKTFTFDSSPSLNLKVKKIMQKMHDQLLVTMENGITHGWETSNAKNDFINKNFLKNRDLPKKITDIIYDPNLGALKKLKARVDQGMNLSDRVWNLVKPFKHELEAGLVDGISQGKSAAKMASDMKQFLNEPDKLFRRVRGEDGVLRLSKEARQYHPGRGVYRSSFKNAKRLTATETNMSYRSADHERWKKQPFVKGIEVHLSDNHPKFDICDHMAGEYPKDFLFRGWHPWCRCNAVPIMVSDEEFSKLEDVQLGLTDKAPNIKYVSKIPSSATSWMKDNAERVQGWKNKPYWAKDNPGFTKILRKKAA